MKDFSFQRFSGFLQVFPCGDVDYSTSSFNFAHLYLEKKELEIKLYLKQ